MIQFSANLGFLWLDRPLPDAIRAAKSAGFHAVECHAPYDVSAAVVKAALIENGLPMLAINTRSEFAEAGGKGVCAVPGREDDAAAAITEAVDYATAIGARSVHVMAGITEGAEAHRTFIRNLQFATRISRDRGIDILIEPLNRFDAPGYFLSDTDQALGIIKEVDEPNLKLMFDCYHVGRTEGDVIKRLRDLYPVIGHIQFASVPDRGPPGQGEIDYRQVFSEISRLGWTSPLGAEYKPVGEPEKSLHWMEQLT